MDISFIVRDWLTEVFASLNHFFFQIELCDSASSSGAVNFVKTAEWISKMQNSSS